MPDIDFNTRLTRLEEHDKQRVKDVAEIKEIITNHTENEMSSMGKLQESLSEIKSDLKAAKMGWKVLVTIGSILTGVLVAAGTVWRILHG